MYASHCRRCVDSSIRSATDSRADGPRPSAAGPRGSDDAPPIGDGRPHATSQHSHEYKQGPHPHPPHSATSSAQGGQESGEGMTSNTPAGEACPYHGPILALRPPEVVQCNCAVSLQLDHTPGQWATLYEHGPECGLSKCKGCICGSLISEEVTRSLGMQAMELTGCGRNAAQDEEPGLLPSQYDKREETDRRE
jgi:hypothetical protein